MTVKNTPFTDVTCSHRSMMQYLITACVHNWRKLAMVTDLTNSVYTLNWGGWVLKTPNWVPGVHDKLPLMIGGATPLLNPR